MAYEYIICQNDKHNPLILSEFAGAAQCLSGAVIVNPWDQRRLVESINECLTMAEEHKSIRHHHNKSYVEKHTALFWIENCIKTMKSSGSDGNHLGQVKRLNTKELVSAYKKATTLLLFCHDNCGRAKSGFF
jgi:trehalose-6-phosphate synthase